MVFFFALYSDCHWVDGALSLWTWGGPFGGDQVRRGCWPAAAGQACSGPLLCVPAGWIQQSRSAPGEPPQSLADGSMCGSFVFSSAEFQLPSPFQGGREARSRLAAGPSSTSPAPLCLGFPSCRGHCLHSLPTQARGIRKADEGDLDRWENVLRLDAFHPGLHSAAAGRVEGRGWEPSSRGPQEDTRGLPLSALSSERMGLYQLFATCSGWRNKRKGVSWSWSSSPDFPVLSRKPAVLLRAHGALVHAAMASRPRT